MKDQKNFLPWVQALRGITALMVVMVHARLYLRGETGEFVAKTFFYPGAMGVDLFFMLSGFLMVLTTTDSDGSWRYTYRFLYRRVVRIWPVYAFTCCLFLALAHYSSAFPLPLSEYRIFIESLLFIPVNPTSPPYFSLPNPVAWTLCFEFYFYVVFALSLCFKNGRWVALSAWFMLTVVAIPMSTGTFNLSVTDNHRYLDFKYANLAVNPIVIEFVLGMLVGKVYLSNVWLPNRYVLLGLTAAAAILIVVLSAAGITTFHGPLGWGGRNISAFPEHCDAQQGRSSGGPDVVPVAWENLLFPLLDPSIRIQNTEHAQPGARLDRRRPAAAMALLG